jgi:GTP:adenosylcobinamide-phosphate guanylyltransferase
MDAIVLAGGIPAPEDALFPYTQGKPKAALDIGGKLMIQWVLDALEKAQTIDRIVIVGCEDLADQIQSSKVWAFRPAADDIILNFQRGAEALLEFNPENRPVALVSSDIPLLTPEIVIQQQLMEEKYPASGRTYTRFKDVSVCGGDLSVIKLDLYTTRKDFWRKIFQARKNSLRQAALIGIDILFLLVLRQLTLAEAVRRVTRRLKITGQGLLCPYPEIGMDIDKAYQMELARQELARPE